MEKIQKRLALSQSKGFTLSQPKGFTLLELLIVIAILAVLATVAVLVINPVEYLRQARDSQRMNDLAAIKGAVDLYIVGTVTPFTAANCAPTKGYVTSGTTNPFTATTFVTLASSTATVIDGTGWIGGINFTTVTGGSPLPKLPIDPTNNGTYFYAFVCNATTNQYGLNAKLESTKFSPMMLNTADGGNNNVFYEVGTSLAF